MLAASALAELVALSLAATANPWLDSARAAYARLDCDQVLADAELALKVPTNDVDTRLAIYDYAGRCHVALGHPADAEAAFGQMLELDPQAELDPSLSPKIREAFHTAKLKKFPADYVALRELSRGEGLVRAVLLDPWRKVGAVVMGRADAQGRGFAESPLSPSSGVYLGAVGEGPWFIEARSRKGEALALLGRKELPPPVAAAEGPGREVVAAAPEPAAKSKVGRRAVGWVGAAVGASAVGVGIALFAVAETTRQAAVKKEWADEAFALERQSNGQAGAGHALFWGGLVVLGVGVGLTF